tara:strand:+ start:550 stop:711 length:162 start_codon:yes stop_codon:yes gene_type:complete
LEITKMSGNHPIADYQNTWKSSPATLLERWKCRKVSKIGTNLGIDISNDLCYY